jgi:hypothetical protein
MPAVILLLTSVSWDVILFLITYIHGNVCVRNWKPRVSVW